MSAPRPLEGLRVADFTAIMSGPLCTRMLADLGADVIKVEPPDGDYIRNRDPVRDGESSIFGHLNAGKRSMVIDLKSAAGRKAALALVDSADIFVENWRPGVATKLGLGWTSLSARRPSLIHCSISGYGQTGPSALRPAYAPVIHAASGYDMAQRAYQGGDGSPPVTGTFVADVLGAIYAVLAIQSALLQRAATGQGQSIDVSMYDCMMNLMVFEGHQVQFPGTPTTAPLPSLRARDGYVIVSGTSQKNFEDLARALGRTEWLSDPRFAKSLARDRNRNELMRLVEEWTLARSAADVEARLVAAGVPCAICRSVAQAMDDPQLASREALTRLHDSAGTFLVPNLPFLMSGATVSVRADIPRLGEHTAQVMREIRELR